MNRLGATYFWKNFRNHETIEKFSKNFEKFSKNFCTNRSFVRSLVAEIFRQLENFRKTRSGRRERFLPKIVEIGAILAIFRPFEDLQGLKGRLETSEMPI